MAGKNKKKKPNTLNDGIVCVNRKARFDYQIEKTIEAGLILQGCEVKSLREGNAQIQDAWAENREGLFILKKLHISPYKNATHEKPDPERDRVLLLHKKEAEKMSKDLKIKGYSLIPLKVYFKGSYAKVELGLGKGRKQQDKREHIKKRETDREIRRIAKIK